MNRITLHLDKIASKLEALGYIKEAARLDMLSNTIEADEIGPGYRFNPNKHIDMPDPSPMKTTPAHILTDYEPELQKIVGGIDQYYKQYMQMMESIGGKVPSIKNVVEKYLARAQKLQQATDLMRDDLIKLKLYAGGPEQREQNISGH